MKKSTRIIIILPVLIYLVSAFIGGGFNPMEWPWYGKIVVIMFLLATLNRFRKQQKQ